ncbi:tripartite motif-containing protein 16-like [Salarias fasciatus]|uniref:tripartite motif-containing protein 16-like n=1 Tax=Salarias fasciatus TaxID=181472 RepID=UPI001176B1A4|nr:tripartite motif-containing protein 16-like [Salarias fasciatus]
MAETGDQPQDDPSGDQLLRYSCEITVDPNTAHPQVFLSEGNRKASAWHADQGYCSHPDRFTDWFQVLGAESLTGRCYWEVEWTGRGVYVAVAYKDVSRAGSEDRLVFGYNGKSWALRCVADGYRFYHNQVQTAVSGPQSHRVGVYLDHGAGVLSFYSVTDSRTLLHRVQASFTQPLHAGLCLRGPKVTARFITPE